MIKVEHIETAGWRPALRGMRNPLDSWDKADSVFTHGNPWPFLGQNDEKLMRRLIGQGSADHCKFRRMLVIYCDVTAPLYWWKEASTYRVGTTMNSCSAMHTIMEREFTEDMFSWELTSNDSEPWERETLGQLNRCRSAWNAYKSMGENAERFYPGLMKLCWDTLIQSLPSSFNQRRTWMLNYEVMANIYRARRHHKLQEWRDFVDVMAAELPYPWIFTGEGC